MAIIFGETEEVRFSYWEYQALMLCLAGTMCFGLVAIELMMKRFQVLPLLFPGMFSIRERRLYFFDLDVDDVAIAKKLRGEAKLLVRIVLFVVLSYLWQHCVLETDQIFGKDFPREQCDRRMDCFAADLRVETLFTRQYEPVDCALPPDRQRPFEQRVVVSCIAFVQPTATTWLMHLGIAHSITQLNFKCYEVLVWLTGNSRCLRCLVCALVFLTTLGTMLIFFIGSVTKFASSWLSVVTSFWIPIFLCTVWRTSTVLQQIWEREAQKVQNSIEEHLNLALADFQPSMQADHQTMADEEPKRPSPPASKSFLVSNPVTMGAKSLLKASGISNILQDQVERRRSRSLGRQYISQEELVQSPPTEDEGTAGSDACRDSRTEEGVV